jgi:hypothetical protein
MNKKIEALAGDGNIRKDDGTSIGLRRYHLTVWQRQHDDGRGGTIPGLFSIEGSVDLEPLEGFSLVAAGEPLTLELADGRKLPFFFVSSDGQIAARGKLG